MAIDAEQLARQWFTQRGQVIEARGGSCPECGQRPITETDVQSLAALIERVRSEQLQQLRRVLLALE